MSTLTIPTTPITTHLALLSTALTFTTGSNSWKKGLKLSPTLSRSYCSTIVSYTISASIVPNMIFNTTEVMKASYTVPPFTMTPSGLPITYTNMEALPAGVTFFN